MSEELGGGSFDEARAKKWFTRLKKVMNAMPEDCELLVSAYGCLTLMPAGSIEANGCAKEGMDSLASNYGMLDHYAKRVVGESCTI